MNFKEWGKLEGQVTNIGQIALSSIKVRATGEVEYNEDVSLGHLLTGETVRFSLQVCPMASGTDVPISIEINYIDQVKRTYNRSISTSLRVINKEKTVSTTTFHNVSLLLKASRIEKAHQQKYVRKVTYSSRATGLK
ncbi:hypothetical protein I8748_04085 [Nostoc sp. CENA67]|uniref:Uncharacterized protein n=1 Tax=Amazonocrinis nigriterrae CENA67 TaxID=2794033 RepID=A0A8J7HPM7_9NOST|nr:hypothetical protein [Amazonocrinis nigriterrae]MBH8561363.1 hypothetical protein [Amazonocrinis nigriterrae CENA67]